MSVLVSSVSGCNVQHFSHLKPGGGSANAVRAAVSVCPVPAKWRPNRQIFRSSKQVPPPNHMSKTFKHSFILEYSAIF